MKLCACGCQPSIVLAECPHHWASVGERSMRDECESREYSLFWLTEIPPGRFNEELLGDGMVPQRPGLAWYGFAVTINTVYAAFEFARL